jgi:hypothetical protein
VRRWTYAGSDAKLARWLRRSGPPPRSATRRATSATCSARCDRSAQRCLLEHAGGSTPPALRANKWAKWAARKCACLHALRQWWRQGRDKGVGWGEQGRVTCVIAAMRTASTESRHSLHPPASPVTTRGAHYLSPKDACAQPRTDAHTQGAPNEDLDEAVVGTEHVERVERHQCAHLLGNALAA